MIGTTAGQLSLRQMAIFIDGLDCDTADQLLESMGGEYELQLRDAIVQLDAVSADERELASQSLFDCFASSGLLPGADGGSGGLANDGENCLEENCSDDLEAELCSAEVEQEDSLIDLPPDLCDFPILSKPGTNKQGESLLALSPLDESLSVALEDASVDSLVKVLRDEHPQLLAVVMTTLPPARAASFLSRFRASTQTEILRRVAEIEQADAAILEEMKKELIEQLIVEPEPTGKAGLHLVHSIISATPAKERSELLTQLADSDHELATSLSPRDDDDFGTSCRVSGVGSLKKSNSPPASVLFDRFVDLDRYALIEVFTQLPTDVAALALAGASQPCLADVLGRLPGDLAQELRAGIQGIGPLRLSDIQKAQTAAVETSRRVLDQSRIRRGEQPLKLSA